MKIFWDREKEQNLYEIMKNRSKFQPKFQILQNVSQSKSHSFDIGVQRHCDIFFLVHLLIFRIFLFLML